MELVDVLKGEQTVGLLESEDGIVAAVQQLARGESQSRPTVAKEASATWRALKVVAVSDKVVAIKIKKRWATKSTENKDNDLWKKGKKTA